MNSRYEDEDEFEDEDEQNELLHMFDPVQAIQITVKRRITKSFRVRYRIAGDQRHLDVYDDELAAICAFMADRADNATLIVTPLP